MIFWVIVKPNPTKPKLKPNLKMMHLKFVKTLRLAGAAAVVAVITSVSAAELDAPVTETSTSAAPAIRELTLDQCLDEALQNNHQRPASKFAVAMAEAQHRQALSAYWPQIGATAGYQRMDEAPDILFRPAQSPCRHRRLPFQTVERFRSPSKHQMARLR